MTNMKVDFSDITGEIRAVHGMNNCDRKAKWADLTDEFKALNVPIVRLHDTCGAYGGTYYVDVPNIFPDFDADPEDPASYDFALTDLYLKYLVETGCEIMYRLGVTIEHAPVKYRIYPPKDFHKWANICEHIVRHYNNGWADGYYWGIKYWEIWNEPDGIDPNIEAYGQPMWIGTAEKYYELYSITANLLKEKHPEIRVGGYSSCFIVGSYRNGEWIKGLTEFFTGFLEYITAPDTRAPLDFFSWHIYLHHDDIYRVSEEAQFARDMLDRYGFTEAENFNTEWNHYLSLDTNLRQELMLTEQGASHYVASLCEMQKCRAIDKAMFYQAEFGSSYSPLFTFPGRRTTKVYQGFRLFGELYALHNECRVENENPKLYAAAAISDGKGALIISNPEPTEQEISLEISGVNTRLAYMDVIDKNQDADSEMQMEISALSSLTLTPHSVTIIRVQNEDMK